MPAATIVKRFEAEHQIYNGISEGRRQEQLTELERLAAFAQKAPQDCQADDLRGYLASLEDLHVNTIRKRLGLLMPFFTFAFQVGVVSGDQLMALKLVKAPRGSSGRSMPKPYSSKELRQFWVELDEQWPVPPRLDWYVERFLRGTSRYKRVAPMVMRLQSNAVMTLALEAGLRRTEIFHASIDHIHPDNECIIVPQRGEIETGKDQYREVPHTDQSRTSVHNWLEFRAKIGVKHDSPWIIGAVNQSPAHALSPITFKSFVNIPLQIGEWELHRFRHTCATLWLRAGVPLEQVQKLLGHATLQQTLAYAEILTDDIRSSVSKNEEKFAQLTRRKR